ncbi:MAG: hypothetical protein EZS28_026569 [Streblomastix strix]|uniref:Uncharacterized protein n=1 Tax=Streblomastix strix TaxID=222440 RepID=A0A5J4V682_9EUKA|nr:MAG: hypothetical protein EZS28_026569 [Streblomastix strix]
MPPKKEKKMKKAIATRRITPQVKELTKKQKQQLSEDGNDYQYAQHMQENKFRQVNYQRVKTQQLAKIPQTMKQRFLKLKQEISQAELQHIEQEIRSLNPQISAAEAHVGAYAITNPAEKLTEVQRQKIVTDIMSQGNLNTVCEIDALDYGRLPINDIYG